MDTSNQNGVLKVDDLYYSFSENELNVQVLSGVSLLAKKGEITSIVGPSGCGKSTLLYLMGLLDRADSGKISMDGQEMQDLNDRDRTLIRNQKIGFVFQFHHLLGEFTAKENILMPLYIREKNISKEDLIYFDKIIQLLEIKDLIEKTPSQISGGESQRVAIARALITQPKIVLADEPTGNLDDKNAHNLYDLFIKLKNEFNHTIVMVTHNKDLTKDSDQIIHLNSGEII